MPQQGLGEQLVAMEAPPQQDAPSANPVQVVEVSQVAQDDWGTLPQEAKNAWAVQGDCCTLEVGGKTLKLPRSVYERLFFYQRQGVAWMWNLYQKGFEGILAD